jgi:murein L,D-transpeptidase YcbB/YkuD
VVFPGLVNRYYRVISLALAAIFLSADAAASAAGASPSIGVDLQRVGSADLRAVVRDGQTRRFYEGRQWQPAWTDEQARALFAALSEADRHALEGRVNWGKMTETASPARREVALTEAGLKYSSWLANGAIDPHAIWKVYTLPKNRVDVVAGLLKALAQNSVRDWLAALPPQDAEYLALGKAYLEARELAAKERPIRIQMGRSIRQGERDSRVPAIEDSLRRSGYLPPRADNEPTISPEDQLLFTRELAEAIARLQADQGLEPDGVVGEQTIEALNLDARERMRMLAINLEARRWLERQVAPTRIDVNIAATTLDYWRNREQVLSTRVVAGQPGWKTPQLGATLRSLTANPPWRVPGSIARKEILPKGAAYMRRNNMRYRNGRIVQAPGPRSALGLIKFDLDDPYAIYLHDTPSKALFAKAERHASHGCVRVQDAVAFAQLIADHQGMRDALERALASGRERPVGLTNAIPVRLLYHTVYLEGGHLVFRHDDYGWDEQVGAALGLPPSARSMLRRYLNDVGP